MPATTAIVVRAFTAASAWLALVADQQEYLLLLPALPWPPRRLRSLLKLVIFSFGFAASAGAAAPSMTSSASATPTASDYRNRVFRSSTNRPASA